MKFVLLLSFTLTFFYNFKSSYAVNPISKCDAELSQALDHLPTELHNPLIELAQLRVSINDQSQNEALIAYYQSHLKTLKQAFINLGFSEEDFNTLYLLAFELAKKTKKESPSKNKSSFYPLKGRTPQVIQAIILSLQEINQNPKLTLEQVTWDDLKKIKELDLVGQNLTTLLDHDFFGLTSLERLNLDDNLLTTLPEKAFEDLQSLAYLRVTHNPIKSISEDAIKNMPPGTQLYFSSKSLTLELDALLDQLALRYPHVKCFTE